MKKTEIEKLIWFYKEKIKILENTNLWGDQFDEGVKFGTIDVLQDVVVALEKLL